MKFITKIAAGIGLFLFFIALKPALATVSDTIHVEHYVINIDNISISTKSIQGSALLKIRSKMNAVNNVTLNLLQFTVDSVKSGSQKLSYSYAVQDLHIKTPTVLSQNDTFSLRVYYHGQPKTDASWGGFYFSGSYAFNMGVGFAATPHAYGKVWYPCVDEFTDHSTYEFYIVTLSNQKAFCNGILQSETSIAGGSKKLWYWKLNQAIPSYLASIAVAPFYTMKNTYNGIPVEWAIMAADSIKTKATFAKIGNALNIFSNSYGPYRWDKAGFVVVPFGSGAMEHATSIHIGNVFVDGTLNYETLWAHELSHHWWGDLVTCESEGDMWLNEGFASYNEALFTEGVYGTAAYKDYIRSNHRYVLQMAHIDDGSYLPLINVPHAYTYGSTVYLKGESVVHSLRNYMGDAKFFQGCKDYMNNRAYGNANNYDFRDELANSSGINMNDFFNDWVFTGGFPHFSIDSTQVQPAGGNYSVQVFTKQKQKGNNHIYTMPVECNFTDGIKDTSILFTINAATNAFNVVLPFKPVWISLDRNEKMCEAKIHYEKKITTSGIISFPETNASLNVSNPGTNGSTVHIEHNWVAADDFKGPNPGIRLSDYHYYKVDGIFNPGFLAKATFTYDGSISSSGYIDNTLIPSGKKEDSLVILYRKNAGYEWKIVTKYTLNKGSSSTDKKGTFTVDTLKKGEYVFGYRDISLSAKNSSGIAAAFVHELSVSPNPAKNTVKISFTIDNRELHYIKIYDVSGVKVYETPVYSHQEFIYWDTWKLKAGMYFVRLENREAVVSASKILVEK